MAVANKAATLIMDVASAAGGLSLSVRRGGVEVTVEILTRPMVDSWTKHASDNMLEVSMCHYFDQVAGAWSTELGFSDMEFVCDCDHLTYFVGLRGRIFLKRIPFALVCNNAEAVTPKDFEAIFKNDCASPDAAWVLWALVFLHTLLAVVARLIRRHVGKQFCTTMGKHFCSRI